MSRVLVGSLAVVVFFCDYLCPRMFGWFFLKEQSYLVVLELNCCYRSSQLLRKCPSLWEFGLPFMELHGNLHYPYHPEMSNSPKLANPLLRLVWRCNQSRYVGIDLPQATEFVFGKQHMICETDMYTLQQKIK